MAKEKGRTGGRRSKVVETGRHRRLLVISDGEGGA